MKPRHVHLFRLGELHAVRGKCLAFVRSSCVCGKKKVERVTSRLVVETARFREKQ